MQPVAPDALLTQLEWRYAVQKFDRTRPLDGAAWDALERTLVLTPSSFGIQPWRFLVVEDPAVRTELRAASWNQEQITDSAKLVVFAIETPLGPAHADRYVARVAEVRRVPPESLDGFKRTLHRFLSQPPEKFDLAGWAARQVYIALGNFMTAAAVIGVDTCPMEGISPRKYDEILGLSAKGLATCVVCCAGHRAPDDPDAALAKVRYPRDEVIARI
jgi:nitroreductase